MSNTVLDNLIAERDAELQRMDALAASEDFDPENVEFTAGRARVEDLNRSIKARGEFMALRASADQVTALVARSGHRDSPATRTTSSDALSAGEEFTRSDVYVNYPGRGTSSRFLTRALPTGLTAFPPQKTTVDNRLPAPPTPLTNLIPSIAVSTNSIDLVALTKAAGGSAVVAEGANKPSVEYTPSIMTITLDTIAGYTQVTRQLIEDQGAIAAMINEELARDVALKMEAEAAAALVAATLPTATSAVSLLEATRIGVGTVQAAGYSPNAVILNPADWSALDIAVLGKTLLGPSVGSQFWGLTPVADPKQPAGTATVGDFSAGASRFIRSGVNIFMTDSHASTFIANVFTILAEGRAKTVVRRPAAFCECTKSP